MFFIDVSEKRNGLLNVLSFFAISHKDYHQKCYFTIDVDEQHHGFSSLRYAIKICDKYMR